MTTNVALTFDIEFNINGAFVDPVKNKPRGKDSLLCDAGERDFGLTRILDILDYHRVRATFFIEALQTAWFGLDEMGDIARLIHGRGHEIQLHLHPVWLQFENPQWREATRLNPPQTATHDSLTAVSPDRAQEIIERGLETFEQWDIPRPTAIRTGSLIIERPIYPLFRQCGFKISSSVGLGIYQPEDEELHLHTSPRIIDGVLEIPVSSFLGADQLLRRSLRLATIIGMGKQEQNKLLDRCRKSGTDNLVVLSHVSEFFRRGAEGQVIAVKGSVPKLEQLCGTVSGTNGFHSATISEIASRSAHPPPSDSIPVVPRLTSFARVIG